MSELKILAPADYVEEVALALIESGVFQVTSKPGRGVLAERSRRELVLIEEAIMRMDQYLGMIGARVDKEPHERLQPRPDSLSRSLESVREKLKIIDREFGELLDRYREYEAKISEYQNLLSYLENLRDLDVDLSRLILGVFLRMKILIIGVERLDTFREEINRRIPAHAFMCSLSRDAREEICLLIYPAESEGAVGEIIRSHRARVFELKEGLPSNLARAYEEAYREFENMKNFMYGIKDEAKRRFTSIGSLFRETYQELVILRDMLRILAHSYFTSSYVVIEGFVPHSMRKRVSDKVLREGENRVLLEFREISRLDRLEEEPPTSYRIPDLLKPFRMIPDLYGTPSYNEIIPVFLASITFPIIFGLMFPDIGHGLAILIAGIIIRRFFKRYGLEDLGLLLVYLGTASIITGFLAGEFFGPATPVSKYIEGFYEELHLSPPLNLPIYKPEAGLTEALYSFILLSVRIAVITLFVSSLLGFLNGVINRETDYVLALALPRLLIFTSIMIPSFISNNLGDVGGFYYHMSLGQLTGVLGVSESYKHPQIIEIMKWVLNISLLWIIFGESIVESIKHDLKSGLKKIGSGFLEVFDTIIMVIGNTMSYMRIMGIALAHIAVVVSFYVPALSLFQSPSISDQIAAWAMYSVGNLIAMTLEAVIAFAHTLRLHLYEMFSKFYRGLGRPYNPFTPVIYRIEIS
ncbi:MAG: V-type ATPase 116kDa subunit family protein [Sulfolobales archaeon]